MIGEGTTFSLESVLAELGIANRFGPRSDDEEPGCRCTVEFDDEALLVDSSACDGDLATAAECRRTVIERLTDREASDIVVQADGLEHRYGTQSVSLLVTAGRFVELVGDRDDRVKEAATLDPLGVADSVRTRIDAIGDIAVESGLVRVADEIESYEEGLAPAVGLSIGAYYVDQTLVDGARLRDVTELEGGSEVRLYGRPDNVSRYELDPVDISLDETERTILLEAYEAIAEGDVDGDRAASRAIEYVTDDLVDPVLTSILSKHTTGYGVLEDLFADPRVTDVYVTSPVSANPIRVVVDGELMATNVYVTEAGVRALASRIRQTSGRSFSRANPTVDATADLENGVDLRIAGVSEPVTDGIAFAFREQADDRFTLPALVENGTMPAAVAGFLSVAMERNAATLIAGTRGAGKTTLLGTLLYELAPDTRTVLIEDTPELPLDPLQSVGRDVQALRTGARDGPEITPADALRTALRLGDGALVVGEIRGEEARVLYEAMRVGANANAVLGTIHGDGADDVYERVVSDLKVEPSSFAATDLVATVQAYRSPTGKKRRLAAVEEVIADGDDVRFEPLYELEGDRAVPTGRIDRGESRLVNRIAGPTEEYADVRRAIGTRSSEIEALADDGRTNPTEVAGAYATDRLH